jgi:hypothetical protein
LFFLCFISSLLPEQTKVNKIQIVSLVLQTSCHDDPGNHKKSKISDRGSLSHTTHWLKRFHRTRLLRNVKGIYLYLI